MYKFRITDKDGNFLAYQDANSDLHAICVAKLNGVSGAHKAEMEGFNW